MPLSTVESAIDTEYVSIYDQGQTDRVDKDAPAISTITSNSHTVSLKRLCVALELGVGFAQLVPSSPFQPNCFAIQSDDLSTLFDKVSGPCWHSGDNIDTPLDDSVGLG